MRMKIVLDAESANRILDSPRIEIFDLPDATFDLQVEKVHGSGVFTQMFDEPFNFDPPVLRLMYFFRPDFIYECQGEFLSIYRFFDPKTNMN